MNTSATTGGSSEPLTLKDLAAAMALIKAMPTPKDEWIIIDPYGNVMKGPLQQVTLHLAREHWRKNLGMLPPQRMEDDAPPPFQPCKTPDECRSEGRCLAGRECHA